MTPEDKLNEQMPIPGKLPQDTEPEEILEPPHGGAPHELEPEYVISRRTEYPDIIEYLDGVVKGDQAQIQAYIDKCLAVKAKYPKE